MKNSRRPVIHSNRSNASATEIKSIGIQANESLDGRGGRYSFPKNVLKAAREVTSLAGDFSTLKRTLLTRGWTYQNKGTALSKEIGHFTSPCGGYLIKFGMITIRSVPKLAIPSKVMRTGDALKKTYLEEWILQPKADVSKRAQAKAWKHFKYLVMDYSRLDIHERNVGMFEGQPVLIDW